MALVKIYRAAYTIGSEEGANIQFSSWVEASGIDEAEARLLATFAGGDGAPPADPPVIVGWEEKELDTEPV